MAGWASPSSGNSAIYHASIDSSGGSLVKYIKKILCSDATLHEHWKWRGGQKTKDGKQLMEKEEETKKEKKQYIKTQSYFFCLLKVPEEINATPLSILPIRDADFLIHGHYNSKKKHPWRPPVTSSRECK